MITIFDIAKESEVSISTVSRVLNDSGPVKSETREKIMKVIEKYDFQPNSIARSLVSKSTKTVGAIVADINNPFYSEIARAIQDTADKFGYTVILCNSDENMEKEKRCINVLLEKQVDGIIFAGGRGKGNKYNAHIRDLSKRIPIVLADEYLKGDNIYSVMCDKKAGAYMAIKYLASLGHEKIGFINGTLDYKPSIEKFSGYIMALEELQINKEDNFIINSDYHIIGGYRSALRLMKNIKKPTAIFAANDLMAIGAIKALKKHGYRVPQDIAVIGFDNSTLDNFVDPPLTSVSQSIYRIGSESTKLLTDIFSNKKDIKKRTIIEPRIVVRESCGEKLKK